MTPRIRFKRLSEHAREPTRATESAACFDVYAAEAFTLAPSFTAAVVTRLAVELPGFDYVVGVRDGKAAHYPRIVTELRIRGRSSLSLKGILCHPGTVDFDYRGEIKVVLTNLGRESFVIGLGDRVAQCSLHRVEPVAWEEAEKLSKTDRGDGGFGSTGR